MYHYSAYGLRIESEIALPELISETEGDCARVSIRLGNVERAAGNACEPSPLLWARAGDACIFYEGVGAFHILGGREISFDRINGSDEAVARVFLLGSVLAILLHQRGLLVLHASAVAVNEQVVAFAAEKGEGKSTFAAAMHARGHPLLTDDLLPIDLHNPDRLMVQPGFPQLKLMPEAAAQLSDQPEDLPRLHPDFEKRAQQAVRDFPRRSLPLSRIFILESAEADSIDVIPPQQRFVELVRHSYLAPLLGKTGESVAHFRQVVALAQRVPVMRLRRRRRLELLPEVARMVEAEIERAPIISP
jgi:hypothetical protein